ncbi:MAG: hypothetical protein ACRCYE_08610 [Sarcina sp.]
MENYKKLTEKAKDQDGFIKTFAQTCRPDSKDISSLDTKGKEINKVSKLISDEEIKNIERINSKEGKKKSVFYKDVNCDVEVFDFDVIDNSSGLLSMDAFMINDDEENYLMVECKERSMVLLNKYGDYLTGQVDLPIIKSMKTVQSAVKSMFNKYKGTFEKLENLECNLNEYFSTIILFVDIRVAENLSLVEQDDVRRIISVEVNKYIERYKKEGFSFQVIYDENEMVSRIKKMDEKIKS